MTTTDSHSIRSRYAFAWAYSSLNPYVVRSPEQTTMSGSRSFTSLIARSSRLGTKCGPPQWRSEMWATVKISLCESPIVEEVYGPSGRAAILASVALETPVFQAYVGSSPARFANEAEVE